MEINGIKPLAKLPNAGAGRGLGLWSGLASKCWGDHRQAKGGGTDRLQMIGLGARGPCLSSQLCPLGQDQEGK